MTWFGREGALRDGGYDPCVRVFGGSARVAPKLRAPLTDATEHCSLPFTQDVRDSDYHDNMRRRRSDELPRFTNDSNRPTIRFRRRYIFYVLGFIIICWFLYPSRVTSVNNDTNIAWSNYAYSLYATDSATLCHAVLLFDALTRVGSKADRALFYPESWDTAVSSSKDRDSQLLVLARDKYKVKLHPTKLLTVGGRTNGTHPELHTWRLTLQN
jgi:hypothetical protein